MGKTTFSGPVRAGKNDVAVGQVVLEQWEAIDVDSFDTALTTSITLPAGARIVQMYVIQTTAFDGARTLEIGDGTDADEFGDVTSLAAALRVVATQDVAQTAVTNPLAADATIVLTGGGTKGTTGAGFFVVQYVQDNTDSQQ